MLFLAAGLMAATTAASSGPDLGEKAVGAALPVRDVMVFSDRARVTRAGSVRLVGGPQVFRAPDLPGAVLPGTVRVTATGSRLVRVETQAVDRERFSIDQVDAWIAELETVADRIAVLEGQLAAERQQLALLQGLNVAAPLPEKDRVGKPLTPAAPAWKDAQDRLARRRVAGRTAEGALEEELRRLRQDHERLQREVQRRDLGGFSDRKLEVLIIVDGEPGDGALTLEYAVPGAFWKPAYDLSFDPDQGTVELSASGLVSQATGEDWADVKLALSTAIPGQGIDLPKLLTWTLGDDRELIPTPTARAVPRTVRPFEPPTPRPRAAEVEREADRELLAQRTSVLVALAESPQGSGAGASSGTTSIDFSDVSIEGALAAPDSSMVRSRRPVPMKPRPAPAPTMAPPADMPSSARLGAEVDFDVMESEAISTSARRERRPPVRTRGLRMASGIGWSRQTFADPLLPAVTAGGFDYVYEAPLPATVPAEASGLRVPLAARRYDVTTFYEATPSLAKTAYLKATVKNGSRLPILAGPANVFVKGTFAGDAMLATTGPGGALELPLGADEDLRLTRTVVPATRRQGLFIGEEDVTDYAVKIDIGNYKKRAVTVRIVDQVPKANHEKVKVELVSTAPKPKEEPDGDGLLYWHVDLPAGATRTVTFTYRITRPKDWRLSQ